jgi:hypothetical protein
MKCLTFATDFDILSIMTPAEKLVAKLVTAHENGYLTADPTRLLTPSIGPSNHELDRTTTLSSLA